MTAPVLMEPKKTGNTGPLLIDQETMSFVLPFEFTKLEQIPKPVDKRIKIKGIPSRIIEVDGFLVGIQLQQVFLTSIFSLIR